MVTSLIWERQQYQQALRAALDRIVRELSVMTEVEQVILFGSYAEGRDDLLTDLDLLVVMHSQEDFVSRTARLYQRLRPGVDLDLLVYTPAEFERLREGGFVGHAVATGKVVYAKKRT
jgi:predicted nucleotidyltransferase